MQKITEFLKKEAVLAVAFILALATSFIVKPDKTYISYIDFRTLGILLSLMLVMAGFKSLGIFGQIGEALVSKAKSEKGIALILISLCFFFSMLITNDVALITFVPFTVITLGLLERKDMYVIVIVLETVAANLGSMLTPLGNPQNLYLYSLSGMGIKDFVLLMLPYSVVAYVLLVAAVLVFIRNRNRDKITPKEYTRTSGENFLIGIYLVAFAIALLVVLRVIPYEYGIITVLALVLLFDRKTLKDADYSLLFTFIFLFIFIGNIKRIPALSETLEVMVSSNEVLVSAALSQVISNVPAAVLCSGFTTEIDKLIVGTNIGGLGTLIASMASLISYKLYAATEDARVGKYIAVFTVTNILFLFCMAFTHFIMQ